MKKQSLLETQIAIKYLKDTFESLLAKKLNLVRVSAPLFVESSTGLNDDLNGVEESVSFKVQNEKIEIVQSLAKWKRYALKEYNLPFDVGIYTDMNAIRKDENLDHLHSIYVDQWDWEKKIKESERNLNFLFRTVSKIYSVIRKVATISEKKWGYTYNLPKKIKSISTKRLERMFPDKSPKERERLIAKEYRAIFIYQIGWPLKNGLPHDGRASDYDDWNLNGDIILYDDTIDDAIELSSMGIRVNADSLRKQVAFKHEEKKLNTPYAKSILDNSLPFTIGGGIGQSRLCMYYLQKKHIGEVQASYWPESMKEELSKKGIKLL